MAWLLHDLCTVQGYCGAHRQASAFIDNPPADVDEFTDRVLRAEGLDPATIQKVDRRKLRGFIEERMDPRA